MTPPLYAALDEQVLSIVDRLGRRPVALLGWVETAAVVIEIPNPPASSVIDVVIRRLVRRGEVELWNGRPPCSHGQMIRRRAAA